MVLSDCLYDDNSARDDTSLIFRIFFIKIFLIIYNLWGLIDQRKPFLLSPCFCPSSRGRYIFFERITGTKTRHIHAYMRNAFSLFLKFGAHCTGRQNNKIGQRIIQIRRWLMKTNGYWRCSGFCLKTRSSRPISVNSEKDVRPHTTVIGFLMYGKYKRDEDKTSLCIYLFIQEVDSSPCLYRMISLIIIMQVRV